jgi:hypothetical protein
VTYKVYVDEVESNAKWLGIDLKQNELQLAPEDLDEGVYKIMIEVIMPSAHYLDQPGIPENDEKVYGKKALNRKMHFRLFVWEAIKN